MLNNKKQTKAPVENKIQCVVSYDIITHYDRVEHKLETVVAKTRKSLMTYLRMKNKAFGFVRNVNILSETLVA